VPSWSIDPESGRVGRARSERESITTPDDRDRPRSGAQDREGYPQGMSSCRGPTKYVSGSVVVLHRRTLFFSIAPRSRCPCVEVGAWRMVLLRVWSSAVWSTPRAAVEARAGVGFLGGSIILVSRKNPNAIAPGATRECGLVAVEIRRFRKGWTALHDVMPATAVKVAPSPAPSRRLRPSQGQGPEGIYALPWWRQRKSWIPAFAGMTRWV
jgi:hypothetical protein